MVQKTITETIYHPARAHKHKESNEHDEKHSEISNWVTETQDRLTPFQIGIMKMPNYPAIIVNQAGPIR
jgi:hypothetical protein